MGDHFWSDHSLRDQIGVQSMVNIYIGKVKKNSVPSIEPFGPERCSKKCGSI